MDLSSIARSLQSALAEIPPVAIGLALLAGPTALLIAYRLVSVARRMRPAGEVEAAPLWVCHGCRSVNELRSSRCYRCGTERDAVEEIEIIVDQPQSPVRPFVVPAGSPFAAVAGAQGRPGVPVMAQPAGPGDPVAVGPGRDVGTATPVPVEEPVDMVEADR